jgi:hypothetical protein
MGRDEMRAADADRQDVAEKLRAALDEGRLDLHEYDERLQQAYAAKTYGDLEGLLTDLPVVATAHPANGTPEHLTRRWLLHVWGGYFPAVGITTAIWLVSSIAAQDLLYFWPIWVAGPWGALLIWQTIGGLAHGEPQARQAKLAKIERKKQAKRERKALEAEAIARGELPSVQTSEKTEQAGQ